MDISNAKVVGNIEKAKGKVQIIKENSFKGVDYRILSGKIELKDIVRTKRKSFAHIKFIDKSSIYLEEKSRLIIENFIPNGDTSIYSTSGKVIYKVVKRIKGQFKVKTPTTLIGVKGTKFLTLIKNGITIIVVKEGVVEVKNPKFPKIFVKLKSGMLTLVKKDKPPEKPIKVEKTLLDKIFSKSENKSDRIIEGELTSSDISDDLDKLILTMFNQEETTSKINQDFSENLTTEIQATIQGTPERLELKFNLPEIDLPQ